MGAILVVGWIFYSLIVSGGPDHCYRFADEHFVIDGVRYQKSHPVNCDILKKAKQVDEAHCFTQRILATERDGEITQSIVKKTFVECPEE